MTIIVLCFRLRRQSLPNLTKWCTAQYPGKVRLACHLHLYIWSFRQPLRAKDLIDVKWTLVRDPDVKNSLISREERFQCAVTGDTLYNSTVACVLRPTGDVVSISMATVIYLPDLGSLLICGVDQVRFFHFQVTQECVDKIIRKDMRHPLTGQSLKEKDIIKLQRGATGFSAANDNLVAEKEGAAMSIG